MSGSRLSKSLAPDSFLDPSNRNIIKQIFIFILGTERSLEILEFGVKCTYKTEIKRQVLYRLHYDLVCSTAFLVSLNKSGCPFSILCLVSGVWSTAACASHGRIRPTGACVVLGGVWLVPQQLLLYLDVSVLHELLCCIWTCLSRRAFAASVRVLRCTWTNFLIIPRILSIS